MLVHERHPFNLYLPALISVVDTAFVILYFSDCRKKKNGAEKLSGVLFDLILKAGINKLFGSGHFASVKEGRADGR